MSKFFKCVVIFNELKVQPAQRKKDRERVSKNVYKIMRKIIWRRAEQKLLWSTFCLTTLWVSLPLRFSVTLSTFSHSVRLAT